MIKNSQNELGGKIRRNQVLRRPNQPTPLNPHLRPCAKACIPGFFYARPPAHYVSAAQGCSTSTLAAVLRRLWSTFYVETSTAWVQSPHTDVFSAPHSLANADVMNN
jgi:hypothetical protein